MVRLATSLTTAKASGRISSVVSPDSSLSLKRSVWARSSSSESFLAHSARAFTSRRMGISFLSFCSLLWPRTVSAIFFNFSIAGSL